MMVIVILEYNPYEVERKLVQDREIYKEENKVERKGGGKGFKGILDDEIQKLKRG